MNFFPGQGNVREFCEWSGKFGKDLEKSGNLKIKADQTSENLCILFKRGNDVLSH